MKRNSFFITILVIVLCSAGSLTAQLTPVKNANYKLAEKFSPNKMKKMVFSTSVDPHWLKLSDRFWYTYETSEGKTFYMVDPVKKTKVPIFDNVKMAAMLTRITKDPYDAKHLPITKIKFIKAEKAIQFDVESSQEEEEKQEEEKESGKKDEAEKNGKDKKKKVFHFEFNLASGALSEIEDYKKPPEKPNWASLSHGLA